jgi:hypothetical protein
MMKIAKNMTELIGNTPLVYAESLRPPEEREKSARIVTIQLVVSCMYIKIDTRHLHHLRLYLKTYGEGRKEEKTTYT